MVDLVRVIRLTLFFCVGLCIGGYTVASHAETITATSVPGWYITQGGGSAAYGGIGTREAVCGAASALYGYPLVGVVANGTGGYICRLLAGTQNFDLMMSSASIYECPSGQGWTLSGSTCTRPDCVAPQTRQPDGTCGSPCVAGSPSSTARWAGTFSSGVANVAMGPYTPPPATLCDGTCVGTLDTAVSCTSTSLTKGTPIQCSYTGTKTGATCSTGMGAAPTYDPCYNQGKVAGTINGMPVCTGTAPTSSTTTKTSTTPGATTTTSVTTACGTDGSCAQTVSNATTSGGSGPNGTGPGSTTTAAPTTGSSSDKTTFCQDNPTLAICKDSSFSGACGSPPACTGDAVACAQAAAAVKLECDISTEPSDAAYTLGKGIAGGAADTVVNPMSTPTVTDVGAIISAAAGQRTLTATCIPNISMALHFGTFTLDTTAFCSYANIVGLLLVALASIHAIKIVAGAA